MGAPMVPPILRFGRSGGAESAPAERPADLSVSIAAICWLGWLGFLGTSFGLRCACNASGRVASALVRIPDRRDRTRCPGDRACASFGKFFAHAAVGNIGRPF